MQILRLFFMFILYICIISIFIFYLFFYLVYKQIKSLVNLFWLKPWYSKIKIVLDFLVIGFYTVTFIFFINKNYKSAFIIFCSGIAFLFIWQSVIMTRSFYEKNKFDLFWQSILLAAVPISLILQSTIKSMPDYFSLVTASAVSISSIKDLCKNIVNLKSKNMAYNDFL